MLRKPYTFDRVVRIVIALVVVAACLWLVKRLSGVLLPFLIGWLIAYLLYPLVLFFQNKCRLKYRMLSIFVTLILVSGVLLGAGFLVVPSLVGECSKMGQLMVRYATQFDQSSFANSDFYAWLVATVGDIDFQHLLTWENLQAAAQKVAPQFFNLLSGTWRLLAGLFVLMVVLLYVIFILVDYEKISEGFVKAVPPKYRRFVEGLATDVKMGMNHYFRGQSLVALCVGILFAIGFSIIGLPMAITMGLFIGVLNLVPYLQTVGLIPVVFLALLRSMETGQSFWWMLLAVAVVLVVVQAIQDLFLTPKIMGKAMGLNPAIILLSLSVFGSLFGIVGMIIALPTTTLLISYYKRYVLGDKADSEAEKS